MAWRTIASLWANNLMAAEGGQAQCGQTGAPVSFGSRRAEASAKGKSPSERDPSDRRSGLPGFSSRRRIGLEPFRGQGGGFGEGVFVKELLLGGGCVSRESQPAVQAGQAEKDLGRVVIVRGGGQQAAPERQGGSGFAAPGEGVHQDESGRG